MKYIVWCLGFVLLSTSSQAQETITLTVSKGNPFAQVGERVLREAYQQIGISIKVKPFPSKRSLQLSSSGKSDGEVHRIKGLRKRYPTLIIIPVPINLTVLMVYSKKKFEINGIESLKPYRIGIVRGIIGLEILTKGLNVTKGVLYENLFEMLNQDRVDVVLISLSNAQVLLKKKSFPGIIALQPPLKTTLLYHHLHQKHEKLVPKITPVLKKMEKSGRIKQIKKQFMAELFDQLGE